MAEFNEGRYGLNQNREIRGLTGILIRNSGGLINSKKAADIFFIAISIIAVVVSIYLTKETKPEPKVFPEADFVRHTAK